MWHKNKDKDLFIPKHGTNKNSLIGKSVFTWGPWELSNRRGKIMSELIRGEKIDCCTLGTIHSEYI
jgi:hypothetical protein